MFTGIISALGQLVRRSQSEGGLELTIDSPYDDLQPGESVAVDGACLTVASMRQNEFTVHIIRTSIDRTNFESYAIGRRMNLERAVRAGDRLGGHLVQGHVDGVGTLEGVVQREDARLLDLRVPPDVARLSVPLGSITLDGVSLTVNAVRGAEFVVNLIPHTLQATNLHDLKIGDGVNLEVDLLARYAERLLDAST